LERIKAEETGIIVNKVELSTLMMEVAVSSEALVLAFTASHSIAAIFEVRFMFMCVIYLGKQHTGCNLRPIIIYRFSGLTALRQRACPN